MTIIGNAQESAHPNDTVQVYYSHGLDAIGGINRRITVICTEREIYCQVIEFDNNIIRISYDRDTATVCEESKRRCLSYDLSGNSYRIILERAKIDKSQLNVFLKILDEIKTFKPEVGVISTAHTHYVIKDQDGIATIIDWSGRYNRYIDIEKALELETRLPNRLRQRQIEDRTSLKYRNK
jgi:hypothetical protein